MEKQLDQPSVARVTLENEMDYTDLIERLNNLVILDEVRSDNRLGKEAADAIEALVKEREQLAALRKQIDDLHHVGVIIEESIWTEWRDERLQLRREQMQPATKRAALKVPLSVGTKLYSLEGIKK